MGMFDDVECEYPLPDGYTGTLRNKFQTKDLECGLTRYRITADGRLEYWEFKLHPNPDWNGDFGKSRPFKCEDIGWKPVEPPYHGDIEFYSNNICGSGPDGFMTENDDPLDSRKYQVRFTNGLVEWIRGGACDDIEKRESDPDFPHITREEWHRKSRERFAARSAQ